MIEVTRKYGFSASHRLHSDSFSLEQNAEVFGKCNNPFGHGHNYELFVTAQGSISGDTGRLLDPLALDALVSRQVLTAYEHKNMNTDVPEFLTVVPTTENVALAIGKRLEEHWTEAFPRGTPRLSRIRICETGRNTFELNL